MPSKGRPRKRLQQQPPNVASDEPVRAAKSRARTTPAADVVRQRSGRPGKSSSVGVASVSEETPSHTHPRVRRPPPYIRPIGRAGSVAIWLVDGSYVRATIDQDFAAYGHHYSNPPIPRQELWLDVESVGEEHATIVRRTLIERRLMARGMDYEAARTVAVAEERKLQTRE